MSNYSRGPMRRTLRRALSWLGYQWRVTRRTSITIEGIRIRVGRHMSRRVEKALSKGRTQRDELQLLGTLLSPDDTVLDIGAGLGLVSAYCAKQIGSDRVYAYEADPDLEPCIRETYQLNGVEPSLEICAVGAQPGRVTLYRDEHRISTSVVRRRAGTRPVEVSGRALNYVVAKIRPTLLVVDEEGAEADLFDGAELPTVTQIVLESPDRLMGPDGTDRVVAQLQGIGFGIRWGLSSPEHLVLWRGSSMELASDLSHRISC
ncbi:MAG TPA: FkbM family methyltransferase [Gemmatimonadales bacterium]|nr:FkbM family methyltransferase [Gemmatimonadales bacterium]